MIFAKMEMTKVAQPRSTKAALRRIAEIDAMFEEARGWSSWMVTCANEREQLVDMLRKRGLDIEHKNLARTASGKRVS